jgi:hypothetical protein
MADVRAGFSVDVVWPIVKRDEELKSMKKIWELGGRCLRA